MRLVQNLLLALGSLVLFFATAEGLARLRYHPERIQYAGIFEYDPDKVFALKRNVRGGDFVGRPVDTDALGYRDHQIPVAKPANGFRVVAVGDSVTFGHGVLGDETWPEELQRLLAAQYPSLDVEVANTAVPGNAPFQEYVDLDRALVLEPDAVVIQFVLNDVVGPWNLFRRYGGKGIDYHGVEDVPYWDWVLSQRSASYLLMKDVVARIRFGALTADGVRERAVRTEAEYAWQAAADDPSDPMMRRAWRECLRWLQREVDLCKAHRIPVVLLATPADFQFQDDSRTYAQKRLTGFASRNAIAYVDLLKPMRERAIDVAEPRDVVWQRYFLDYDHLTPAGHALVANLLVPLIAPIASARTTPTHSTHAVLGTAYNSGLAR